MHFQPTLDALEKRGYKAQCIELATVRTDKPRPTWDEEVFNISDQVLDEMKTGNDVCLMLHSYAGLPGCEAVNRIVQAGGLEPTADRKERFHKVIFFAAHHTPTGLVMDIKNYIGPANPFFGLDYDANMSYHTAPFEAFFTDFSTREEAQPYIDEIKPMYYIPGGGGIMSEDWIKAPRGIIGTIKDQAMVPAFQEEMWQDFRDEIEWIDTGHTPFMVLPDYIADVLIKLLNKPGSDA